MKPRKWAAEIKQWADGAEIQIHGETGLWLDLSHPTWGGEMELEAKEALK